MSTADIFLGVLAILFPPIAVWIKRGICSADSLLNILLVCVGYLPGLIHAWYIIARYPEDDIGYEAIPEGEEGGRVTYYYVSRQGAGGPQSQRTGGPDAGRAQRQQQRTGPGYGTASAAGPVPQPQASHPQVVAGKGQPQHQHQPANGAASAEGSGQQQQGHHSPPTYAEAVKGDNKIQTP